MIGDGTRASLVFGIACHHSLSNNVDKRERHQREIRRRAGAVRRFLSIDWCVVFCPCRNRNVTCYFYIRQSWSPHNETILISVGPAAEQQPPRGRRRPAFSVRTSREEKTARLASGAACRAADRGGDSLTIHNGATVRFGFAFDESYSCPFFFAVITFPIDSTRVRHRFFSSQVFWPRLHCLFLHDRTVSTTLTWLFIRDNLTRDNR